MKMKITMKLTIIRIILVDTVLEFNPDIFCIPYKRQNLKLWQWNVTVMFYVPLVSPVHTPVYSVEIKNKEYIILVFPV